MSKAIILMGGPSRGTRFRPLSLELPKPLFPIAGIPLVEHHIIACKKLKDLKEILLLGFYKEEELKDFVDYAIKKHEVKISYLNETCRSGTAGGLFIFKDRILEGNPEFIFILHSDVVCSFPLEEIRDYHQKHGEFATIMATKVPKEHSSHFGCIISDENNNIVHFAEKPTTFISDLINTGVYCFSKDIINEIEKIQNKPSNTELGTLYQSMDQFFVESSTPYVRLEQDVIFQHVGTGKLKAYIYNDFWRQIKNAGSAVYCNSIILGYYSKLNSPLLTKNVNYQLVGNNIIDKTAVIDPSAKIGPNVFIGPGVKIGKGVRIKESIILTNTEIKDHACLLYCIIGWDSVIGNWSRIEGIYNPSPYLSLSSSGEKREGITIFGKGARAKPEIIVYNCIVMPHKDLDRSYKNSILL